MNNGIRDRLLAGETVNVQGKYTAKRFQMGRVEGALGIYFLCAFENGRRVRNENVMWGTESAEAWIRAVRIAPSPLA